MSLKAKFNWSQEPLYLIDGTSFLYRAFYAYPDLNRSDGFPTNAIYIVLRLLIKIIREEHPFYCCFFLDGKEPTFRHQLLESYKAQRQKMPESLNQQITPLLEGISHLGLVNMVSQGGEVDDYIASLCKRFKLERPVVIVGSDKDLCQCLDYQVILWDPGQKKEKVVTRDAFLNLWGLTPDQWPDYQALVGDSSDNIPGISGIGPKTAIQLLQRYNSLEQLYSQFDHLSSKEQKKLASNLDQLFLYQELTRLRTDLCPNTQLDDLLCSAQDIQRLQHFFQEYEFKSLYKELPPGPENHSTRPEDTSISLEIQRTKDSGFISQNDLVGLVLSSDGGMYLGNSSGECFFYPSQEEVEQILSQLKSAKTVFLTSYKELLEQNMVWEEIDIDKIFDLSLAAYLLNPEERSYDWARLLDLYLGQVSVHRKNQGIAAFRIGKLLWQQLNQANLLNLMYSIELPLIPVLVRMEQRGIRIDLEAFENFLTEVETEIGKLSRDIFQLAGTKFNIRSAQQLSEILFEHLKLKPGRKTPGGKPSTSSQVLESLQSQHPIVEKILSFRSLEKLRSTYLSPLPQLVDARGRLHTHFNHLATATGRLSSSTPNLQNIPIRGKFGPRMRQCFVANHNKSLIAADYSQIELRILAHMSQDPHLLTAFSNKEDIHTRTACLLFNKISSDISDDERRKAKTINFGLIYGMGPQKLGRELSLSLQKAKEFIQIYFQELKQVRAFYDQISEQAKEKGYVTTISGRRRLLKDINSRNDNLAQQSVRMAINTVIQGSAADIIKIAMIEVDTDQQLREEHRAELILQVHDELLLEVPEDSAQSAGERLAQIMSQVYPLLVPLTVEWGQGKNWSLAH
ncbi:MAG TPA: DNA polymerase I [Desulfohalobiaceae bacterium]|nr:DNA polymerase I [Desulfohalobiaceae bacterium]